MKKSLLMMSLYLSILLFSGCSTPKSPPSEKSPVAEVPEDVQEMIKKEEKDPIPTTSYTAPTVEEFYKDMEKEIKKVSEKAASMSPERLAIFLKKELTSHEPHLVGLKTREIKKTVYKKVISILLKALENE